MLRPTQILYVAIFLLTVTAAKAEPAALRTERAVVPPAVFDMLHRQATTEGPPPGPSDAVSADVPDDAAEPRPPSSVGTALAVLALRWTESGTSAKRVDGVLEIPVCWIDPQTSDLHRAGRDLTKKAVQNTWNTSGAVRFTGWAGCPEGSGGGVRIEVADVWPEAVIGRAAERDGWGVRLNFDLTLSGFSDCRVNVGEVATDRVKGITWEHCVYSLAVHEFGHVLGLVHDHEFALAGVAVGNISDEALRAFRTACAAAGYLVGLDPDDLTEVVDAPGWTAGEIDGRVDSDSVMNYCRYIYDHNAEPSPYDIALIADQYGE